MCELFTIAAGTLGASQTAAIAVTAFDAIALIGTVASTVNTFSKASGQQDQLAYQAAVENNKAIVRDRQAAAVVARGEEDARTKKAQIKTMGSRQLVTLAGQGGDVTTGTSVDLLAETKELGKLEEEKIRNNAARDANSIRIDATNARADAGAARLASNQVNPLLSAASSGLQGFGQVGAQWYNRGVA